MRRRLLIANVVATLAARMRRTTLLTLSSAVLVARPLHAQRTTDAVRDSLVARARDFFTSTGTPGLAVGVWRDGRVVLARGFGVRRAGAPGPVTARTVFHLASVSKTFVAAAILQLVSARRVALDSPVTAYLPGFTLHDARTREVTVRRLLAHTAGMPDVTDYGWDHPEYDDRALERWIGSLRDSSLIAAPGAAWEYSNIGYELLAHVVATVSGETFEGYVRRHVFSPLGMTHSSFLMADVDSANLALGHESSPSGRRRAYPYNRRHAGSSTLHADVADMLRYGAAIATRDARLLPPAGHEQLATAQIDLSEKFAVDMARYQLARVDMGLGWFLLQSRAGDTILSHDGADRGFRSALLVVPARRIVIVVLVNASASATPLAHGLLDALSR
ncbi:MAG: beta-lactamase family protein [Gemmatimonadetes bacterium]|nr:beta-lactamase family protein [Gemmatimonadota bacterium]